MVVAIIVAVALLASQQRQPQPTLPTATQNQETEATQTPQVVEKASPSAAQETVTVTITNDGFSPQSVSVKAGGKVTWTNNSGALVQINSAIHPTHLIYPPLNLGTVAPLGSVSLVFDKAGTYKYHNHLDPSRTGTVVVE